MKKTIFLVFFILFVAVFAGKAEAQRQCPVDKAVYKDFTPIKMIFLPDTHISFKDTDDWILNKESFVVFQDVIKDIKAIPEMKFVVFGGDLTDNEDNELTNLPLFLDTIEDANLTYYAILGDREADLKEGDTKQNFCAEFRRNGFESPDLTYWTAQPSENVLLIGLDTSVSNKFEGNIPKEELSWLDNTLKSNPDKFTIITMHHPAFISADADENIWKRFILGNSDEFLNVINKYPQVKLILSGHHHNYAVKNLNGKLFMAMPSIATYPNQYKILKIYPDRVEVENKEITFRQISKKAKNIIVKTKYAEEFDSKNPNNVLKFQRGDEFSRQKVFYY